MRVIRFTPKPGSELGNDPLFGVIEDDDQTISVINGDPLFNGIAKSGQITKLEEVRLLAYKLMIDKFNEKYAGLSQTQKNILKEYINNISNTTTLKAFLVKESKNVDVLLAKIIPTVKDQITAIKLKEVRNILAKFEKIKTIKEEHVLSLLLYHELLKELKNAKQKA